MCGDRTYRVGPALRAMVQTRQFVYTINFSIRVGLWWEKIAQLALIEAAKWELSKLLQFFHHTFIHTSQQNTTWVEAFHKGVMNCPSCTLGQYNSKFHSKLHEHQWAQTNKYLLLLLRTQQLVRYCHVYTTDVSMVNFQVAIIHTLTNQAKLFRSLTSASFSCPFRGRRLQLLQRDSGHLHPLSSHWQ